MEGIVFDIQRFALHDGPGIRTTVFLKGCPLRCLWCHNPESQQFEPQVSIDREKPGSEDAVKVIGTRMSVADVMREVQSDYDYYLNSGGGMTVSGGEPMAQFPFALELCKAGRAAGIHTCLDTSGYASRERFEEIAPWVDLFLYDYKATEPSAHRSLTGVSNEPILGNLDMLYRAGASIILRCPLIPGVNDTEEHLRGIAKLARKYPNLARIELMPYHDMGNHKAVRVGQVAPLAGKKSATNEEKQEWLEKLSGFGCSASFG